MKRTPRTAPTGLRAPHVVVLVAGLLAATSLAGAVAALAVPDPRPDGAAVRVTELSGSSKPVAHGTRTSVMAKLTVENRSRVRQPSQTAYVFIVDVSDKPSPDRSFAITSVKTPALAPLSSREVTATGMPPAGVTAGSYRLRVCLSPRGEGPCTVSTRDLVRIGAPAVAAAPRRLDFPDTGPGSSSEPMPVSFTNTGRSRIDGLRLALSGDGAANFRLARPSCARVEIGDDCSVRVFFSPREDAEGEKTATLTATTSTGQHTTVVLSGIAGSFSIRPSSYDYGEVAVGAPTSHTFEIVNNTDTDATLSNGNIEPYGVFLFDYAPDQNTCLSFVVPAQGSCTFSVGFSPSESGPAQATVVFDGDWGYPVSSALSGTGVVPPVERTPAQRRGSSHYGVR